MPTEILTSPSVIPSLSRVSAGTEACVIVAGCEIRDLNSAKTLAENTQLDVFQNLFCVLERTGLERDHAAKSALLPLCQLVLRMRDQTGIINLLHRRMFGEEIRDDATVLVMGLHPDSQRFCAAQDQERVKRRKYRPDAVLDESYPFGVRFVI